MAKAGGYFIDVWNGFTNASGQYITTGPDIEGQVKALRTSDGINFTSVGKQKLAYYVERDIRRHTGVGAGAVDLLASASQTSTIEIGPDGKKRLVGPVISLSDPLPGVSVALAGAPDPVVFDPISGQVIVQPEAPAPEVVPESETARFRLVVKGESLPGDRRPGRRFRLAAVAARQPGLPCPAGRDGGGRGARPTARPPATEPEAGRSELTPGGLRRLGLGLGADDRRAAHHRLHLAEGDVARQVFHPAVGRDDDLLGRHIGQGPADALGDRLRRLDRHVVEVDDAEDDRLSRQRLKHRRVELRLRGLDRDLVERCVAEFRQERIASGRTWMIAA